jgi:glycosyltransferase involved in cell wall biosynthesis
MIHAIICGFRCDETLEKCIESVLMQTCRDRKITVHVDNENNRQYLVGSTVHAIQDANPDPEDIIACIDADDFLCDERAFEVVLDAYRENPSLLLTYGSYVNLSTNQTGKFTGAYAPDECFRTSTWRASHLKTFKAKLWNALPKEELLDAHGNYFRCCADRAMMIPMMELAGHDRIKHIPTILYCYDDTNSLGVWQTMRILSKETRAYIAAKSPLRMIEQL